MAIIDETQFHTVKARREKNKARARRNQKRSYLLSGHIRCSCGYAMKGLTVTKNNYRYYECIQQSYYRHLGDCEEKRIRGELVDSTVWEWITELLGNDDNIELGLQEMMEENRDTVDQKYQRLETIDRLIERAERKTHNLVSELGETENEMVLSALRTEVRSTAKQQEVLIQERNILLAELEQTEVAPDMRKMIL